MPNVLLTGVLAGVICLAAKSTEQSFGFRIGLEITPYEFAGAVLGLLLVLWTNSVYDRWCEARKIRGGIINHATW